MPVRWPETAHVVPCERHGADCRAGRVARPRSQGGPHVLLRLSRDPAPPPPCRARPRRRRDRAGGGADARRQRAPHRPDPAPRRALRRPRGPRRAGVARRGGGGAPRDRAHARPGHPGGHAGQRGRQHRRDRAVPVDRAGPGRAGRRRPRPHAPHEPLQPRGLRRLGPGRPLGRRCSAAGGEPADGGGPAGFGVLFWLFASRAASRRSSTRGCRTRPCGGRRPAPRASPRAA